MKLDLTRPAALAQPSRKASMTNAHKRNLGFLQGDNPLTSKNETAYATFGDWMRAAKTAIETGWYDAPTKNPHIAVSKTVMGKPTGPSVQDWSKTQKNIDADLDQQQQQERRAQQAQAQEVEARTAAVVKEEAEDQSISTRSNTQGAKVGYLGESVNVNVVGPLGRVTASPISGVVNKRQDQNLLNDNVYTASRIARAVSRKTSVQKTIDRYYKSGDGNAKGAPDSGAYEGAVSSAADDQSLSDDDFWGGYEAGTAAYDKANSDGKSGGGKIVCTAMNARYGFGGFRNAIWLKYARDHLSTHHENGYHTLFQPLVDFAYAGKGGRVRHMARQLLEHIARHRTKDIWCEMRGRKRDAIGRVERAVLEPLCFAMGWLKG